MAYEIADRILKYLIDVGTTTVAECVVYLNVSEYLVEIGVNDIKEHFPGYLFQKNIDKNGGVQIWLDGLFKEEAIRVLKSGGLHIYTLSEKAEKEKKVTMEKLDIESKITAINTAKQSVVLSKVAIIISVIGTIIALIALINNKS